MAEIIAVCAIVGGVVFLAGRSFYRTFTGKNDQCGCGAQACSTSTCCNQWATISEKQEEQE
jgi:hypothetical protein